MPRPKRSQLAGAVYHISTQANRTEALYLDAIDYRTFFSFVGLVAERHELELHAWCAMTTHYHLLFTTRNDDLAAAMHRLNSRYAHWWNDVHGAEGHVFRRRYTAVLVETEEHLKWCYRYIAMNPVKAGICDRPELWRWSSFAWLFGGGHRVELRSGERQLFRHFGEDDAARMRLRRYVETGL
jgi:REP element-mobilizing transposase RayT